MTIDEQQDLIEYGRHIDTTVMPHMLDGQPAVAYGDMITNNPVRAFRDLQALANQLAY